MMKFLLLPALLVLLSTLTPSNGLLRLPAILGSQMVLQSAPLISRIWGTADPSSTVSLSINPSGFVSAVQADPATGEFIFVLPIYPPGGPYGIILTNNVTQETVALQNVLFGDVFLCSGQSNMELNLVMALNSSQEIADSINYPNIRVFSVAKAESNVPLNDVISRNPSGWLPSSPASVGRADWYSYFSAVCYFFGRDTHRVANVPIGLISSAWGGTRIEAWSSPDALNQCSKVEEEKVGIEEEEELKKALEMEGFSLGRDPNDASALFNAMIHPILRLGLKGVTWYQGESNAGEPNLYSCRFPAMISSWRKEFSNPDLSFYFVQLAPYNGGGALPAIREAQTFGLTLPRVCMGTAIDLWDPFAPDGEIHPRNKQVVGARLSLCSQYYDYSRSVDPFGPLPTGTQVSQQGNEYLTLVSFQTSTLLATRGTESCTSCCSTVPFFVQGPQGNWTRASRVTASGNTVQVFSPTSLDRPVGIRYAWEDIPQCAIYDQLTSLVAPPFQRAV